MSDVEVEQQPIGSEEEEEIVEEEEEFEEEEEEFVTAEPANAVKLFGKWSFDDIEVRDISLEVRARDNILVP